MNPKKIYFAGDLFDHKDLTGNLLLADAVAKVSDGRYQVMLPQDSECNDLRSVSEIRDRDLELLFSCDCIVANFDGTELDSGTVVEFCFAKMLDMPAVLLRTDFRKGGDNGVDPWNLMCSGYPRSRTLLISAMEQYHLCRKNSSSFTELVEKMHLGTAEKIVSALDGVCSEPPLYDFDAAVRAMKLCVKCAGGILSELLPDTRISELVNARRQKGICQ